MVGSRYVPTRQPYERSPLLAGLSYDASLIGPHSLTTRGTYTLPAGRFAHIVTVSTILVRDVVATTAAIARATVQNTGNLSHEATVLGTGVTGAVNDRDSVHVGESGFLISSSSSILIQTADGSTGGSFTYHFHLIILEHDA